MITRDIYRIALRAWRREGGDSPSPQERLEEILFTRFAEAGRIRSEEGGPPLSPQERLEEILPDRLLARRPRGQRVKRAA
jgi:hypothetical protein